MKKLIVIDDEPQGKKAKIEEAAAKTGFAKPIYIEQNDEAHIAPVLKEGCDLIILDWVFPPEAPQGPETLDLIRRLGFKGPIIIYSKMFNQFQKYIQNGKANAYIWHIDDADTLATRMKGLIRKKSESAPIPIEAEDQQVKYFASREEMKIHFYHPMTTKYGHSDDEIKAAMDKVFLASTEFQVQGSQIIPTGKMGQVIKDIENVASTGASVFIRGETGTGKELVAKLLHYHHSNKRKRYDIGEKGKETFQGLNCGAFKKELLDVELFGSLPGSFTSAILKAGVFEQITVFDGQRNAIGGGTIFLDEIGDMELPAQAYLLRVLEERCVFRMGHDLSKTEGPGKDYIIEELKMKVPRYLFGKIPVKFRLVSATNKKVFYKVQQEEFRQDLLFRICENFFYLPSLESRSPEDFNLLFQLFHHKYNEEYGRLIPLAHDGPLLTTPSADLVRHLYTSVRWPGNVRQLERLIGGMISRSSSSRSNPLTPADIQDSYFEMVETLSELP